MLKRNRLISIVAAIGLSVVGASPFVVSPAEAEDKGVVYALYSPSSDWTLAVFVSLQLCQMVLSAVIKDDPKFHAACQPMLIEDADRFVRSRQ